MSDAKTSYKIGGNQAKGNPKSIEAQNKVGNVRSSGTTQETTGRQPGFPNTGVKRRR